MGKAAPGSHSQNDRDRETNGYGSMGDRNDEVDSHPSTRRTPEAYARQVLAFAKRSTVHSLYPGLHYGILARLLISPYLSFGDEERVHIVEGSTDFIQFYDLATSSSDRRISTPSLQNLIAYDDETRRKQPAGRLLFMQGYPSPQWLNLIGSKFDIDPEFFCRHLQFEPLQKAPTHFFMSSLPSAAEIIQIRITSILSRVGFQSLPEHNISDLRSSSNSLMAEYLRNLINSSKMSVSDSIVRRFSVHDKQHFSVEQTISICVTHKSPGWIALIWLDHGNDLGDAVHSPWKELQRNSRIPKGLAVLPTIQYRNRIALKREQNTRMADTSIQQDPFGLPQTASCLAPDYGRSLRPEIMESDAFYALDEIFCFAIASESQFLEMMRVKIKAACATDGSGSIEELDVALDLMEDHRQSIRENLETVRKGGHSRWPRASGKLGSKAVAAQKRLEEDYEYLLDFADRLANKCTEGITVLMNDAVLRQSQRAIEQTEATMKLTLLAFTFAPLSFTTSFFSMQVKEIENKSISIWVWCLFTCVLLISSFCFWKWRPLLLLKQCWSAAVARVAHSVRED